jgi:hypothetical protein
LHYRSGQRRVIHDVQRLPVAGVHVQFRQNPPRNPTSATKRRVSVPRARMVAQGHPGYGVGLLQGVKRDRCVGTWRAVEPPAEGLAAAAPLDRLPGFHRLDGP